MRWELTVVSAPPELPSAPVEYTLEAPAGAPGSALRDALRSRWPKARLSVAGLPLEELQFGNAPLLGGAIVVAGEPPQRAPATMTPLALVALSGPDAGRIFLLPRGRTCLGRGGEGGNLTDPEVSRVGVMLDVDTNGVVLTVAPGAVAFVDGVRVHRMKVTAGSVLELGQCRLSLQFLGPVLADECQGGDGEAEPDEAPLVVASPRSGRPGAVSVTLAGIPVLLGLAMGFFTGNWLFAGFAAMPAATGVVALVAGRRRRRKFRLDVAAAATHDGARRVRNHPSPAVLLLAASGLGPWPHPWRQGSAKPPCVRVGTATLPAAVTTGPPDPSFCPPLLPHAPLCLPLRPGGSCGITASADSCSGVLRAVLMQLDMRGIPTAILGFGHAVHLAARLLPNTAVGWSGSPPLPAGGVLLIGPQLTPEDAGTLRLPVRPDFCTVLFRAGTVAPRSGSSTFQPLMQGRGGAATEWTLEQRTAGWFLSAARTRELVGAPGQDIPSILAGSQGLLTADQCDGRNFERYARRRAAGTRPTDRSSIPVGCTLAELQPLESQAIAAAWKHSASGADLSCIIGVSGDGPEIFDFCRDGPHLLVAGTTGSGKSELLRTLLTALVGAYGPSALQLLLLDFKGGAGLGPFEHLPHVAALVTDLEGYELERTIASLTAEVRHREGAFRAAGVGDFREYAAQRNVDPLPRLLVAVDEFRMLVESSPATMAALMKVAAVGRSLGIHLVLATQRPQGAISADIRSNITSTICLRVQSPAESLDVLGDAAAAAIPVLARGRGYLRRGSGPPVLFQCALTAWPEDGDPLLNLKPALSVAVVHTPLPDTAVRPPEPAHTMDSSAALAEGLQQAFGSAVAELKAHRSATHMSVASPVSRNIVAPPLPSALAQDELPSAPDGTLALGWLDVPPLQTLLPLLWSPFGQGHLALLGVPGSGAGETLWHVVNAATAAGGSKDADPGGQAVRAMYVLDGDGSLADATAGTEGGTFCSARIRGYLRPEELRTVDYLLRNLPGRRIVGSTQLPVEGVVLIAVSGWGQWQSAIRSSPWPWLEDRWSDFLRDAALVNVRVLVSGARELAAARFLAVIPNRLRFPGGATPELLAAWPPMPTLPALAGRGYASGPIAVVPGALTPAFGFAAQALLATSAPPAANARHSGAFMDSTLPLFADAPLVRSLPATLEWEEAATAFRGTRKLMLPAGVWIGLSDGSLAPRALHLPPGSQLIVTGTPRSGRSNFLAGLPQMNEGAPRNWLRCPEANGSTTPSGFWCQVGDDLGDPSEHMLLVDDVDLLDAAALDALRHLLQRGACAVTATRFSHGNLQRSALTPQSRQLGMVLAPAHSQQGEFFAARLDCYVDATPGRAAVIESGVVDWVQIPLMPPTLRRRGG